MKKINFNGEELVLPETSDLATTAEVAIIKNDLDADIQDLQDQIDGISTDNLVDLETNQEIGGVKTFKDNIGLKNADGTVDYLKHINNNFLISTSTGTNLMNIDEGLSKAYFFNKEVAYKEDITGAGGTKVTVGGVVQETFNADTKADKVQNQYVVQYSHKDNANGFLKIGTFYVEDAGGFLFDISQFSDYGSGGLSNKADFTNINIAVTRNGSTITAREFTTLKWISYKIKPVTNGFELYVYNYDRGSDLRSASKTTIKANGYLVSQEPVFDLKTVVDSVSGTITPIEEQGRYALLTDIPTKTSDLTNDSSFITSENDPTVPSWAKQASKPTYTYSEITEKPTLATVATSGNYNDLSNKPAIPDVSGKADLNNANQTITANDIVLQGFSMFNYCADLGSKITPIKFLNGGGISSNTYLPVIDVGQMGIVSYRSTTNTTLKLYLPSSGSYDYALILGNPYHSSGGTGASNGISGTNTAGGSHLTDIVNNSKYTAVMVLYRRVS